MISQRCPRCYSKRIRQGYRPTRLWSKFLFRFNLLCDDCNWEFKGFAVPGTVSKKSAKSRKKQNPAEKQAVNFSENDSGVNYEAASQILSDEKARRKRRVKVRL